MHRKTTTTTASRLHTRAHLAAWEAAGYEYDRTGCAKRAHDAAYRAARAHVPQEHAARIAHAIATTGAHS